MRDYNILPREAHALSTLVARAYIVYNHSRAASDELAEEMVRTLVRCAAIFPER